VVVEKAAGLRLAIAEVSRRPAPDKPLRYMLDTARHIIVLAVSARKERPIFTMVMSSSAMRTSPLARQAKQARNNPGKRKNKK